jgi:cytochrome c peroxidase
MIWRATLSIILAGLLLPAFADEVSRTDPFAAYRPPSELSTIDDAASQARIALGRTLFYDPILSGSRNRSCATCHQADLGWGDGRARAQGEVALPLRSPTLLNVVLGEQFGWDGKFGTLEAVAFIPITSPKNMNLPAAEAVARLTQSPAYVEAFAKAFGSGEVTKARIEDALADFERTIVSGPAPFDHWVEGDESAISASAKRGFALFNGKAGCAQCHSGWAFTDGSFHDIGTATGDDLGRGKLFPTSLALRYAFKTPTLRDIALRAPYMHNGSVPSLEAVIDLYDRGGIDRPSRSPLIRLLGLTTEEKADLLAFLQTLTSVRPAKVTVASDSSP